MAGFGQYLDADLTAYLPIFNSMSLSTNIYSVLEKLATREESVILPKLRAFGLNLLTLGISQVLLLIVTLASLIKKLYHLKKEKSRKIWLWRKHYTTIHNHPYYVPNSFLIFDLLIILSCIFIGYFSLITYKYCVHIESISWLARSTIVPFMACCFTPLFVCLWWSSWSSFYIVYFSPTFEDYKTTSGSRVSLHPVAANLACIGIPVWITLYFTSLAVLSSYENEKEFNGIRDFYRILRDFSAHWKPNDPTAPLHNNRLFEVIKVVIVQSKVIISFCEIMGYSWALISMLIIMAYTVSAIFLGKLYRSTLRVARGEISRLNLPKECESNRSQRDSLVASLELKSQTALIVNEATSRGPGNPVHAKKLQRNYNLLRANFTIVIAALLFNFIFNLIFSFRFKKAVLNPSNEIKTAGALLTASATSLSFAAFIQTLLINS